MESKVNGETGVSLSLADEIPDLVRGYPGQLPHMLFNNLF